MDKKLVIVLISFAVVITGTVIMLTLLLNQTKYQNLPYCSVDVWKIADSYLIDKGLNGNRIRNKKAFIEKLTNKIKEETKNPYQYGCKAIFMKGAILSTHKDITRLIEQKIR